MGAAIILDVMNKRFLENMDRHPDLSWDVAERLLLDNPDYLVRLKRMEESGGEPDTIGFDDAGKLVFCDCSRETPVGRRSVCYDDAALQKRKKNPPSDSAEHQAREMGIELMPEAIYRRLQETGEFDLKTSSWISTPVSIRKLGGALFCERRYGAVFTFHNGADSYYSVRGWRGYFCL